MYPWFDRIFLLTASGRVILERLATSTNNPYGKRTGEIERTLEIKRTIEPELRRVAGHVIDTDDTLEEVVEKVPRLLG